MICWPAGSRRVWGPKGGGRCQPPFERVPRHPGAAQTPNLGDFGPAPSSRKIDRMSISNTKPENQGAVTAERRAVLTLMVDYCLR